MNPERTTLTVSVAGHPPPVIACPQGPPHLLKVHPDLPVGVGDAGSRRNVSVTLPKGSTVVLYTDGLVERRGEVLDLGLARLCGMVGAGSAEEICSTIVAGMDVADAEDDIAVLTMRTLT